MIFKHGSVLKAIKSKSYIFSRTLDKAKIRE